MIIDKKEKDVTPHPQKRSNTTIGLCQTTYIGGTVTRENQCLAEIKKIVVPTKKTCLANNHLRIEIIKILKR